MDKLSKLLLEKNGISGEIAAISSMRKGVLNEQFVTAKLKDGRETTRGPYFVLTRKGPHGKTVSKSIPSSDADFLRSETENYKRFRQLTDKYVEVCEQISLLQCKGSKDK